jgi:tetratricopeptide (TPR) repeat protein
MASLDPQRWSRISALLDRVLDVPEEERARFLAELPADDRDIADKVSGILAAQKAHGFADFLNGPGPAPAFAEAASHAGWRLGPYVIEAEVGRGGMGSVWRARRADGRFEGFVAIKLLNAALMGKPAEQRFMREGNVLASLQHPNIAHLLDAGVADTGQPYLVLEYVEGVRIDQYCESANLSGRQRIALFADVLAAVTHAHSHLVVHRDLKPSNILVTRDGVVKLLDFGIAALLAPETPAGVSSPTVEMAAIFTPDYAAPEQLLQHPVTTATDVYALGLVLFVLLVGKHAHTNTAETAIERMRAIVDHDAPQPSAVAGDAMTARLLRGDLDAICSKALRRLPQERYATTAAFADDLRRFLGDEPVAARANLAGYRARKFVSRHRGAVLGTLAAVLGLIVATGFALVQMREARIQRDRSVAQARQAEKQAEFVSLMMSTVGETPTTAEQLMDAGHRLLDKHYASDPRFRAAALINLSSRYADLGLPAKSHAVLEQAETIGRDLNDPLLLARSHCALAGNAMDLGDMKASVEHTAAGKAALARVTNPDPVYVVDCLRTEADLADAQGNVSAAVQLAERGVSMLEKANQTRDLRFPELLNRLSDYHKSLGDSKAGFEYSNAALAAFESMGLGDTDEYLTGMHNVASSLNGFGELQESCKREHEVVTRLQATGRTIITAIAVLYGNCLLRKDDAPADALAWFDKGIAAAVAGQDPTLEMHGRQARARALIALNRFTEARAELDHVESLAKRNSVLGSTAALRAQILRGQLLLIEGSLVDARGLMESLTAKLRTDSAQRVLLRAALAGAARVALAQKRYSDASSLATEALAEATRRARDPAMSADVGESALLIAQAKAGLGDSKGAHEAARQAVVSLSASVGDHNELTRAAQRLQ